MVVGAEASMVAEADHDNSCSESLFKNCEIRKWREATCSG